MKNCNYQTACYYILTGLLFILLVYGSWFTFQEVEFNRNMLKKALGKKVNNFDSEFISAVDKFYLTNFPDGNIFIYFDGLKAEDDGIFLFVQYMRASYLLHPRRVFVSPSDAVLKTSEDILKFNTLPSHDWLVANNVKYVLTYKYQNSIRSYDINTIVE